MRKSILILSSFLLLAGCVGEENLDYDKTWNEDFDYIVDDDGTISVPSAKDITDTIDLRIFDVINLDYPGLEKVKEAYEAGKLYAETHPAEDEGTGEGEGGETGDGSGESAGESSEGDAAPESKADAVSEEGPGDKDGYYKAAWYLLDYFRTRTNVKFPQMELNLINASYTDNEKTIADKALDGHFYVRNFEYMADDGKTYTDFPDFGKKVDADGKVTYNWGMAMPSDFTTGSTKEWRSQQHRHQWMLPEAKVYRATEDEKYIEDWKTVYRSWVDACKAPENAETANVVKESDNVEWYGLQPAERLIDQCSIFYYYLDSENFTPGYLTFFLSEFAKTANIVMSNPYMPKENDTELVHNITLTQNRALYFAGTLFPELAKAAEWEPFCTANIEKMSHSIFMSDGGPAERDPSYHIGNISGLYDVYILANGNSKTAPFDIKDMEKGCEFTADVIYLNYSIDNFNDTRSSRYSKNVLKTNNLMKYREMFPDNNKIRYMASEGKDGNEPEDLVQVYPETGYYMLRTGWTAEDAMMVVKNNPDGKWHCQYDNLTFGIYSNGISFSPDAGCYTYDDNSLREMYAAADYHNTMIIPDSDADKVTRGQKFEEEIRTGEFLGNGSGRNYEWVAAQNQNYSSLAHRRAAFLVNSEFFVLVDEGFGTYSGKVKLQFKCGNPNGKQRDNFVIDNCVQENVSEAIDPSLPVTMHTNLSGSSNIMFVTFPETTDGYESRWTTNYFCNDIINNDSERIQRKVYEVNQNKPADGAVRFITVIYPYGAASEYDDLDIKAEFTDRGFSESGASVKVTVDKAGEQTICNLSYTL